MPKARLPAKTWEKIGVKTYNFKRYTIQKDERETGVNFLESEKNAEIETDNKKWQNRLESMGIEPVYIVTYSNTLVDTRRYILPKKYIPMPSGKI